MVFWNKLDSGLMVRIGESLIKNSTRAEYSCCKELLLTTHVKQRGPKWVCTRIEPIPPRFYRSDAASDDVRRAANPDERMNPYDDPLSRAVRNAAKELSNSPGSEAKTARLCFSSSSY